MGNDSSTTGRLRENFNPPEHDPFMAMDMMAEHKKNGDLLGALIILDECIRGGQADSHIYFNAASLHFNLGNIARAKQLLQTAIPRDRHDSYLLQLAGDIAAYEEKYNDAIEYYTLAAKYDRGRRPASLGKLCVVYRLKGDMEQALTVAQQIIDLNEDSAIGWSLQSQVLRFMNKPEEALVSARISTQCDPKDPIGWILVCQNARLLGYYDVALEAADHVLQHIKKEKIAVALSLKCLTLREMGRSSEAVSFIEKASRMAPDNAHVWSFLAQTYRDLHRNEAALYACRKVVELEPEVSVGWGQLAQILRELRRPAEALKAAMRATKLAPDNPYVWSLKSQCLMDLGDVTGASLALNEHDKLTDDRTHTLLWRGRMAIVKNDYKTAEQIASKLGQGEFHPKHMLFFRTLAALHIMPQETYRELLASLKQTGHIEPDDTSFDLHSDNDLENTLRHFDRAMDEVEFRGWISRSSIFNTHQLPRPIDRLAARVSRTPLAMKQHENLSGNPADTPPAPNS